MSHQDINNCVDLFKKVLTHNEAMVLEITKSK